MSLYMKLLKIQEHVLGLKKDKKSFSYSYVTGDKVLNFIKPIMNQEKVLLKQEIIKVEKEIVSYKTKNGEKTEVLYSVWQKFTWVDCETGEKDENEFFASGMNDWEKGLGSALTYAERYFLLKYFHIATDEDDIDNDKRKEDFAKTKPFKLEYSKENAIELVKKQDKEVITKIMDFYKVFEIEEIEEEELKKLFKKYNK